MKVVMYGTKACPDCVEAEEILKSLGLKGEFEGEGEIKEQSISAGEIIKSGDKIKFKLEG